MIEIRFGIHHDILSYPPLSFIVTVWSRPKIERISGSEPPNPEIKAI